MKVQIHESDPKSPLYLKPITPRKKKGEHLGRPGKRVVRKRERVSPHIFKIAGNGWQWLWWRF